MSGSSTPRTGLLLTALESTAHCFKLVTPYVVKNPVNERRCSTGDGGGTAPPATESKGKSTAIEGYPQEEQPALLMEFPSVWVPQHPRLPPAAQPPSRPPKLFEEILVIHPTIWKTSDYKTTTPLVLSRLRFSRWCFCNLLKLTWLLVFL